MSKCQKINTNTTSISNAHNLNIQMYSFKEVLELFGLGYEFGVEDLKRAKLMVLKMHPDKSRLSSEYFLFYKKAYEVVFKFYEENTKTSAVVPDVNPEYSAEKGNKNIGKTIQNMVKAGDFHGKFNELFEENMAKKVDTGKNDWFKNNDPLFQYDEVKNKDSMLQTIHQIKAKNAAVVVHRGIQDMFSGSSGASSLYDDDENDSYVTCDPFSKLKFDDLRKVHKDQTVFAVSERDFDKVQKFGSVDEYNRSRGAQVLTPLEKGQAERMLKIQEDEVRQRMLAKQHAAQLESMKYEEKNKNVMANFLRLN